jgi:hypothetical protein
MENSHGLLFRWDRRRSEALNAWTLEVAYCTHCMSRCGCDASRLWLKKERFCLVRDPGRCQRCLRLRTPLQNRSASALPTESSADGATCPTEETVHFSPSRSLQNRGNPSVFLPKRRMMKTHTAPFFGALSRSTKSMVSPSSSIPRLPSSGYRTLMLPSLFTPTTTQR